MSIFTAEPSIWEKESFFQHCDVIIVGAGLSGLWAAFHLKKTQPNLLITILERGTIPSGASTRNAGFACFGSLTELIHDFDGMGEAKTLELVSMRYRGLKMIMETFNPAEIGFSLCGGYELIRESDDLDERVLDEVMLRVNRSLAPVLATDRTFTSRNQLIDEFGFKNVRQLIVNPYEGYLHSGKLCQVLMQRVQSMGVSILTGINVNAYTKSAGKINLMSDEGYEFSAGKLILCTNAFTPDLIPGLDIVPARGQVLLTDIIPGLRFKGTFHADQGYYYFRNLGSRILLGGARNSDFAGETSSEMHTTAGVQAMLENFLKDTIIPGTPYTITDRWSGIMAMGSEKTPIVKEVDANVYCAVRMSGMGVALTPVVGQMLASMLF